MSEVATLGGGCFWCLEAVYSELKGVLKVESGYSGGNVPNPSYEEVCSNRTGHAEVVQIVFNPQVVSYKGLLQIFFSIHDPTTMNRQGADVGTQYRSVVFYHSQDQERAAREIIDEMRKLWTRPIVTELVRFDEFYRAEEYHQNYFKNNPSKSYCQISIEPKVAKFRKQYFDKLK